MDKYQLYLSGLITEAQYNASIEKKEEKVDDKKKVKAKDEKPKLKKLDKKEKKEKLSKKQIDKKLGESFQKPDSTSFKEWIILKENKEV